MKSSINHARHNSIRRFITIMVFCLGVLLVIGTLLDLGAFMLFHNHHHTLEKFIEAIFYSALGFVCLIIGLERAVDLSNITNTVDRQTQTLEKIDEHLLQFRKYKLIHSYHEIYDRSILLIEKCNHHIRTVIYASSPKAPDSWNERVAEILSNKAKAGNPIEMEIIFCMNPEDLTTQFIEAMEKRLEPYKKWNSIKYVHMYFQFMEKTIGNDSFIIDEEHLLITFPTILSNITQKGFLFEHQPETVKPYVNWFNSYAKFEALSLKSAKKQIINPQYKFHS